MEIKKIKDNNLRGVSPVVTFPEYRLCGVYVQYIDNKYKIM